MTCYFPVGTKKMTSFQCSIRIDHASDPIWNVSECGNGRCHLPHYPDLIPTRLADTMECPKCGAVCAREYEFRRHLKGHDAPSFSCRCGAAFRWVAAEEQEGQD